MIDLKLLIKNGVHFGHQAWRWCPKMERFIWGKKNGIHFFDVSKTATCLEKAAHFLEKVATENKQILWVGTKKPAQTAIKEVAQLTKSPYVTHRWIGGTLTNFPQVKKSVTKLLHYEDIIKRSEEFSYTKKEFGVFQKLIDRLESNVGGIRELAWPIGAVVVIDARKEHVAIKEARTMGIPVLALVDSNSDPSGIDYVIPGNDDVPRSIKTITDYLQSFVMRGLENAAKASKEIADKKEFQEKSVKDNSVRSDKKSSKVSAKKSLSIKPELVEEIGEDDIDSDEDPVASKKEVKAVLKKAPAKKASSKLGESKKSSPKNS